MSRSAWELASGSAKDSALVGLFKGASLIGQDGAPISVLTGLKDRTVLLYFAASWVKACKSFNELLSRFYDMVRETDDSIRVIFVSNDKSKEEQLAFFREGGLHKDWLMVEWTYDLQDIMDNFKIEKIPSLTVVDRDGKAVVEEGHQQILDLFTNERGKARSAEAVKASVAAKWAEWRKLAGDWRASEGHTLGSGGGPAGSSSSSGGAAGAPAGGVAQPGTAQSDREALRAARLAALERRMAGGGGGGGGGPAGAAAPQLAPAAPAASQPAPAPAPAAAQATALPSGPRGVATIHGGSQVTGGGGGGSGTFAAGAAGAPSGGVGYTLAGGRVEVPVAPVVEAHDLEGSDIASDGAETVGDESADVDMDVAMTTLTSMGFSEEQAREALRASQGDVDGAVALLVGDA